MLCNDIMFDLYFMSQEIFQVLDLVKILKDENALDLFMDLLDLICHRFPAEDPSEDGEFVRVRSSCESQESSAVSVSPYGFQILEAGKFNKITQIVYRTILRSYFAS